MRYRPVDGVFTDLEPISYLRPPNVIVKAADCDYREIIKTADLYAAGKTRNVIFEKKSDGTRWYLELVPYVHPTGAADITLGAVTYDSSGIATAVTCLTEGRFLNESGVQIAANEEGMDVAGMSLGDYWYHLVDELEDYEAHRALVIEEGDFLWLVRRGVVYGDATVAVNDGDNLMSSATVAGEVEPSTAINTAGTVAQYDATLVKHLTGDADPERGCCLGQALETIGAAGLCKMLLKLPDRHIR